MRNNPGTGLAITTGTIYAVTFGVLLRDGISLPFDPLQFSVLAAAIAAVRFLSEPALRRHRAGIASRVRLFVVLSGVSYLVFLFSRGRPSSWTELSHVSSGYQVLLLTWAYGIAGGLAERFSDHRWLLHAVYRHRTDAKRREALHDVRYASAESLAKIDYSRRQLSVGFLLMNVIVILGWINGQFPSAYGLMLLAVSGILRYLTQTGLEGIADEYRYMGDGGRLPGRYRRRRIRYASVLLGVSALVAVSVARPDSLIPYSHVQDFFAWLSGLFPRFDLQAPVPQIEQEFDVFRRIANDLPLGDAHIDDPPAFLQTLLVILQGMIRSALIGGLLLFLGSPLLSRSFRKSLREAGIRRACATWMREVLRTARLFLHALRRRALSLRPRLRHDRQAREAHLSRQRGAELSPEKQRELAQVSRRFARLLRWAQRHSVSRRQGEAPGEFTQRLSVRFSGNREAFVTIGRLYEKSLFSQEALSDDEHALLFAGFRDVLRSNP